MIKVLLISLLINLPTFFSSQVSTESLYGMKPLPLGFEEDT